MPTIRTAPKKQITLRLHPESIDSLKASASSLNITPGRYVEWLIATANTSACPRPEDFDTPAEHRLRMAFREIKAHQEGRIKLQTLDEFIDEL